MDLFRSVKRVCRGVVAAVTPAAAATKVDALPVEVLQHIFCLASTWQKPGSCLAAPVCSTWRKAAASCAGTCLLYQAEDPVAERCDWYMYDVWGPLGRTPPGCERPYVTPGDLHFTQWLTRNIGQLQELSLTFTLSSKSSSGNIGSCGGNAIWILWTLVWAAEEAQAAGLPLPLHTLRVLGVGLDPPLIRGLLRHLPSLRCLQLMRQDTLCYRNELAVATCPLDYHRSLTTPWDTSLSRYYTEGGPGYWKSLQQATQLQELYLQHPSSSDARAARAGQLPCSLKRLGWDYNSGPYTYMSMDPDLAHLTQLSFLQLHGPCDGPFISQLPAHIQAVDLPDVSAPSLLLPQAQGGAGAGVQQQEQQQQEQQQLSSFRNVCAARATIEDLRNPASCAVLVQQSKLSALAVKSRYRGPAAASSSDMQAVVSAAASIPSLRHLDLDLLEAPPPLFAAQLTGLTRLTLARGSTQQHHAWAAELGGMPNLKWLSVGEELLAAGRGWLSSLKQLRVLVLQCEPPPTQPEQEPPEDPPGALPWLHWLRPPHPQALPARQAQPPPLLMLGLKGIVGQEAASWQQCHSSQLQWLLSSGCELVAGADLDQLGAEAQQLAGWPEAVRQALA
jgi:hypothetical protein